MTTQRKFFCNVCRDEIEWPFGGAEGGFGISFTNNTHFKFVKVRDAENHICDDCAFQISTHYSLATKEA